MSTATHSLTNSLSSAIALLGSLLAKPAVRLAAFALIALITAWPMLGAAASLNGYRDSHPLVQYEESARRTVVEFHQVPLWDPYYCGGMDGLGTPQSRFASPTFLLTLAVGSLRAEPLMVFLFLLLGLEGAFRYARSRGATFLGAALAAPIFGLSGFFAVAPALGWIHFMGFELVPWIVWGLRRAMRGSHLGLAVSVLGLAFMVGFGGTYPAPMTALFCAWEVGEALWSRRHDKKRLTLATGMAILVAVLSLGVAAVRLWPVMQTLVMAPRIIGGAPMTVPGKIVRGLLGRIKPDDSGDFPINGNYLVGIFPVVAVAVGIARRKTLALTTAAFLTLWLASGYAAKISLFAALKVLPVYSTLRYPERFLVLFALAVSALAALGVTRLQSLARTPGEGVREKRLRMVGTYGLTLAVTLLLANLGPLVINQHVAENGRPMEAPPRTVAREFHQARGTRWSLAEYGPMSRGVLSCYDAYPVPQSPLLRGDLKQEVYLADGMAGTVTQSFWSPNRLEFDVDVTRPTRVMVNQNWHPGWRSSVGTVVDTKGLLTIDVPEGKNHLVVRFLPRAAIGGAMVSLASLAALLWIVLRDRFRKKTAAAPEAHTDQRASPHTRPRIPALAMQLAVALFAVLGSTGLAFALVKEAPLPPHELKLPDGESIVLDALPPDVKPLGVHFGNDMILEGARLPRRGVMPEETITVDLFWRVNQGVDTHLGIFVHLEPNEGDEIRADHVMLSEVIEPERAPKGALIRDAVTITIPHDLSGKRFRVFAGVWRVRGNTKRVAVSNPGSGQVQDDRVELGSFDIR